MLFKSKLITILFTINIFFIPSAHVSANDKSLVLCVTGVSGDTASFIEKSYVDQARKWGGDLDIKNYSEERKALDDFKYSQCDMLASPTPRTKQFNSFLASIDAIGAIPDVNVAKVMFQILNNPALVNLMSSGEYESAGVIPVGFEYLMSNKPVDSISDLSGKKIATFDAQKMGYKIAQFFGMQPVSTFPTSDFVIKFNSKQVDVVVASSRQFKSFELYRPMDGRGVFTHPINLDTVSLLIRKNKFPKDFGLKSREYISAQIPEILTRIEKQDIQDIPDKYKLNLSDPKRLEFNELLSKVQLNMLQEGLYSKTMLDLADKVTCKIDTSGSKCKK